MRSKPNSYTRRDPIGRQMEIVRRLKNQHGLTIKDLAKIMKVSERTVRRYMAPLLEKRIVVVNFTFTNYVAKRPVYYYAIRRVK